MNDLVLMGIVAIYLLVCVAFGFLRGLAKSRIRCITVAGSAVLAFIITLIVKAAVASSYEGMSGAEIIGNFVSTSALPKELLDLLDSTALSGAVGGMVTSLIMPIIYIIVFAVLCFVTWIIHIVITLILKRRLKQINENASHKVLQTALMNLLQGIVVVFVIMSAVNTYARMIPPAVDVMEEADLMEQNPDLAVMVDDYIKSMPEGFVLSAYRFTGGELVCNALTRFEVEDEKVFLNDEIDALSNFACNIIKICKTGMEKFTEQETAMVKSVAQSCTNSKLLSIVVGEVLYNSTDAWLKDEAYFGITTPSAGEMFDPILNELIVIFNKDAKNSASLQADINTTADMMNILLRRDLFSKMSNSDALIKEIGADNSSMIKELVTTMESNESMIKLKYRVADMGIYAMTLSMNVPNDKNDVYQSFLGDVTFALNATAASSGTARVEVVTDHLSNAFDNAGVVVEDKILELYAVSLIADLGPNPDVQKEDVAMFFGSYANEIKSLNSAPAVAPLADAVVTAGYATLAKTMDELSKIPASTDAEKALVAEKSKEIINRHYTELLGADNAVLAQLSNISLSDPIEKSVIDNTAGMKDVGTMNTVIITRDQLLTDVENAVKLTPEELAVEANSLALVFSKLSALVTNDADLTSLDSIVDTVGPVLNALRDTETVGADRTKNLLVSIVQCEQFRNHSNMDMIAATNIANKATKDHNGKPVDYEKVMNSMSGVVTLGNSLQTSELTSPEDLKPLLQNMTPQTADLLGDYITPERMEEYGMGETSQITSDLLNNLFDELAENEDATEEEANAEAESVQHLMNVAVAAKDNTNNDQRLFGEEGKLKETPDSIIGDIIASDAVCNSIEKSLKDGDGNQIEDPYGLGSTMAEGSEDREDFINAIKAEQAKNPDDPETIRRLKLASALFGIDAGLE